MATATEVISRVQRLLGDPHGDYHEDDGMLEFLNLALHDISSRSLSVDGWAFLPVTKDIFRYALPEGFLQARIVGFYSDANRLTVQTTGIVQDWYPLKKRSIRLVDVVAQRYHGGTLPVFFAIGGRSVLDKLTGTVVSHDDTDLLFESSHSVFAVKPGDRLLNMTDGSETYVQSVTTEDNSIGYQALGGGVDNIMAVDDEFRVVSPQASRFTLSIAPAPSYDDDMGYESLSVYFSRLHREVTQFDIDSENDELELDPELDLALIHHTCYYASMSRNGIMDKTTLFHSAQYENKYLDNIPQVRRRIRESSNAWPEMIGLLARRSEISGAPQVGHNPFTNLKLS